MKPKRVKNKPDFEVWQLGKKKFEIRYWRHGNKSENPSQIEAAASLSDAKEQVKTMSFVCSGM